MQKILDQIQKEPVAFQAIVQGLLALLLSFGAHLTVEQMACIMGFTAAVLAFWTRQQVTSHPNNPLMNPQPPAATGEGQ